MHLLEIERPRVGVDRRRLVHQRLLLRELAGTLKFDFFVKRLKERERWVMAVDWKWCSMGKVLARAKERGGIILDFALGRGSSFFPEGLMMEFVDVEIAEEFEG